jgi:hypothetical protein
LRGGSSWVSAGRKPAFRAEKNFRVGISLILLILYQSIRICKLFLQYFLYCIETVAIQALIRPQKTAEPLSGSAEIKIIKLWQGHQSMAEKA